MTYSNPNYIPLDQLSFTESNEELDPDRRSLIMAPIIHYECAVKYHSSDEGLVNEDKVLELAKANKDMIANGNEQAYLNLVIEQYGEFLASN
mgnify:FL=1|tara:strand:+ start:486 stop:761 length:276 start_codon:yes stop_codon:yes gene_type:complete